jgi:hypothetical protein
LRGNCLLNHLIEGKIEGRIYVTGRRGEEDVSSYWMILRKSEGTSNLKRKH